MKGKMLSFLADRDMEQASLRSMVNIRHMDGAVGKLPDYQNSLCASSGPLYLMEDNKN